MTVSAFLREKNKILKEYLNLDFDLVPEDQIEECEQLELDMDSPSSCPYCMVYGNGCKNCPMEKAGNGCKNNRQSTWVKYITTCRHPHASKQSPAHKPMKELIDQYNKELK